jgi:membrane fusion protein
MQGLFREVAVEAQQTRWLGDIVLAGPVSFTFLSSLAATMAALAIAFLSFGTYTKRSTVPGQLLPDLGIVKVFPPQNGVIVERRITEGQPVKRGDIMFVLSSERESVSMGGTQAYISEQVRARQESLRGEIDQLGMLEATERSAIQKKERACRRS